MKSLMLRGVAAALVVIAAACSTADSVAPATLDLSASRSVAAAVGSGAAKRTIDQYVWASCMNGGDGEAVHVTGEIRYDMQVVQDGAGVSHLNIKSNTSGLTAVGQTSGTFFRATMSEHVNSRAEDILNEDIRASDIIRFTAPGSRASYSLMVTSHIVVDGGNYVVWDETWNEVCR